MDIITLQKLSGLSLPSDKAESIQKDLDAVLTSMKALLSLTVSDIPDAPPLSTFETVISEGASRSLPITSIHTVDGAFHVPKVIRRPS